MNVHLTFVHNKFLSNEGQRAGLQQLCPKKNRKRTHNNRPLNTVVNTSWRKKSNVIQVAWSPVIHFPCNLRWNRLYVFTDTRFTFDRISLQGTREVDFNVLNPWWFLLKFLSCLLHDCTLSNSFRLWLCSWYNNINFKKRIGIYFTRITCIAHKLMLLV